MNEKVERRLTMGELGKAAGDIFGYPGASAKFRTVRRLNRQAAEMEQQSLDDQVRTFKQKARLQIAEGIMMGAIETSMIVLPPLLAITLHEAGASAAPIGFFTATLYGAKTGMGVVTQSLESLIESVEESFSELIESVEEFSSEFKDHAPSQANPDHG